MGTSLLHSPVAARIDALLPPDDRHQVYPTRRQKDAAILTVVGVIGNRRVAIIASDPDRASGAIGRAESVAIVASIGFAHREGLPIVLLLDSAGAKLDEGVPVLGACRMIEHKLLEARAGGCRVAAVIGRNCFGGAAIMAFNSEIRVYPRGSRLGQAGPRALEAAHPLELETLTVAALFGAESRARQDEGAVLVTDDTDAVLSVLRAWLAEPPADARDDTHRTLTRRLRMYWGDPYSVGTYPPPPEIETRLDHLFSQGWNAVCCDGVVWGDGWIDDRDTCFAGFMGGRTPGVFACWRFAEVLREFLREPVDTPVTLLLDCPGQRADAASEQMLISEYVAAISRAAYALRRQGRSLELWIVGQAGGAIYGALAAAAGTITAWPGVKLQTLPSTAVSGVIGPRPDEKPSLSVLIEARVIDRWTRSPGFGEWPEPRHPPQ